MPTTSTIGSGGRNYSTITAWIASILTIPAGGYVGNCYNDGEFNAANGETFPLAITGFTTSAANYITLTTAAGQSFADNAGAQTNALRYNQSNGVGINKTSNYNNVIDYEDDYVTFSKLQIIASGQAARVGGTGTAGLTHSLIDSCILEAANPGSGSPVGDVRSGGIINSLICNNGVGDGLGLSYADSTPYIVNCTIVRPSDVSTAGNGIFASSGNFFVENTAIFNFSNLTSGGAAAGSNNCSDLAIGFGTSNQASKTYANQFVNTVTATRDFREKNSSADIYNTGVTDATKVPSQKDIVGTSRPQSTAWDIGAWELVAAAPPATNKLLLAHPIP